MERVVQPYSRPKYKAIVAEVKAENMALRRQLENLKRSNRELAEALEAVRKIPKMIRLLFGA